jgi:hypothetical protein
VAQALPQAAPPTTRGSTRTRRCVRSATRCGAWLVQRHARVSLTRRDASCGTQPESDNALAALSALSADAVTDSAAWPAICPALRCALAAPPSSAAALALLRRLVRSAHASRAAVQLAQLAATLAAHLQSPATDAADAAGALLEAEAALCSCWQARAPQLRARDSRLSDAFLQGLRANALSDLAEARVALLRIPTAAAALDAAEREPAAWPATWVAMAPACSALATALRQDAQALPALVATAFAPRDACIDDAERATAVLTLGTLLQSSAVRALFPVSLASAESALLPAFCDADDAALVSLPLCVRCFAHTAAVDYGSSSDAAARSLARLVSMARGSEVVAAMDPACMRVLAMPLLHRRDDGASDRAAAVLAAIAESGKPGVAALCMAFEGEPTQSNCTLGVVVAAVCDACAADEAHTVLKRQGRTLAAAFRCDAALRTVVLPAGLPAALASAHAAADPASADALASALAALAWTPRGTAALCAAPGGAEAAAAALSAIAAAQLAAAARDGEPLPGTAAWRDARYAASTLGSQPRGAAALRSAGWPASVASDALCDSAARAPAFASACTAVEALLADGDPGTLIALRRDGTAPAALLAALLALFADASRWPDAAGHASLAAVEGYAAALVAYPAALLLGPMRGAATALLAADGDASGGDGVLLSGLLRAAGATAFSAAAAADAMRRLSEHPAMARFRADAALA